MAEFVDGTVSASVVKDIVDRQVNCGGNVAGYQTLMEGLAAQGNVAEAIQIYGELRSVLRDELGVDPSSASQAVYTKLMRGSR